ncbi:uncharacterized protein MONOS_10575 [Monocercomonoides exilis]|uniref:uncharacterized protein n=1 Tax=Monocercomonoides exilis TaxID=2049356 RepID=UPI00355A3E63|nr:hypothetical protein MONOS_10575 [Monocercomonoides exilis]|eukprot:MONOS_10575.1-p1 / transcript=MONOS_10575.1 / gene=MONOS_10575 / organism=Monocercomonoides_exilis_PA203 / gene_product=unspecified product / transcript_product=unspecified product / location=Mono_scaffold00486:10952-13832(+) / protein_length=940 / sequence_SO=supercontig / SO=protein_coding / is_pseudo=false
MLLSLFIFICQFRCAPENTCSVNAGVAYDKTVASTCLKYLPKYNKDLDEVKNLVPNIINWLDGYAYRDMLYENDGDLSVTKVDIIEKLKKLVDSPKNYEYVYEFYQDVANTIAQFDDPNLQYHFPCSDLFSIGLPFWFEMKMVDKSTGDGQECQVIAKDWEQHPRNCWGLTERYLKDNNKVSLENKKITGFKIGTEEMNKNPCKALSDWAEANARGGFSKSSKMDIALSSDFSFRPLWKYPIPSEKSITVEYEYYDETKKELIHAEKELPFYTFVHHTISNNKVEEYCPLRSKANVNAIQNNKGRLNQSMVAEIKAKEKEAQAVNNMDEKTRSLHQYLAQSGVHEQIKEEVKYSGAMDTLSAKGHSKTNEHKLKVSNDGDAQMVIDGQFVDGVFWGKKDLALLAIESFAPSTDSMITSWIQNVRDIMIEFVKRNKTRLVLDLRGNEGGSETLAGYLLRILFPTAFPFNGPLRTVKAKANQMMMSKLVDGKVRLIMNHTSLHIIPELFGTTTTKKITPPSGERSQNWTSIFSINGDRNDALLKWYQSWADRDKLSLTAQNVVVVVDGRCMGACGQFAKHLAEKKLARVVSIGGGNSFWESNSAEKWDIGGSSSAYVVRSSTLGATASAESNGESNAEPKAFDRTDSYIQYSMMDPLSFEKGSEQKSLQFKRVEPYEHKRMYLNLLSHTSLSDFNLLGDAMENYFNICMKGEVRIDPKDTTCYEGEDHTLKGRPCSDDRKSWNTQTCVVGGCVRGYYFNNDGKCVAIPKVSELKEEDNDNNNTDPNPRINKAMDNWVLVLIICLGVLLVVSVLVIVVVCATRKKPEQKKGAALPGKDVIAGDAPNVNESLTRRSDGVLEEGEYKRDQANVAFASDANATVAVGQAPSVSVSLSDPSQTSQPNISISASVDVEQANATYPADPTQQQQNAATQPGVMYEAVSM